MTSVTVAFNLTVHNVLSVVYSLRVYTAPLLFIVKYSFTKCFGHGRVIRQQLCYFDTAMRLTFCNCFE